MALSIGKVENKILFKYFDIHHSRAFERKQKSHPAKELLVRSSDYSMRSVDIFPTKKLKWKLNEQNSNFHFSS
jgi:hypothetical protein